MSKVEKRKVERGRWKEVETLETSPRQSPARFVNLTPAGPSTKHQIPPFKLPHQHLSNPTTMSGASTGSTATTKATVSDSKDTTKPLQPQKAAQLEEDDEFEDFPVEGIPPSPPPPLAIQWERGLD